MTSGVAAGRLSMEDVVRVGAENTARVVGLYPRKGVLAPGADADVVIVDPDLEATVDDAFYDCLCEVASIGVRPPWTSDALQRSATVWEPPRVPHVRRLRC